MSIYAESSLGTASNKVDFNRNTTFPVYRVISRQPQRRDIRDLDIPIPFENGISDFETLIGKVAYVIEGIMYPGNEAQYDAGLRALRKLASLDIAQADVLSDDGYVPYQYSEFNNDKIIFMKVLYVDLPESTRKGLVQPFRLICKIKDPIIYGATVKQATTDPADFTLATGSAVFPIAFPVVFGASTTTVSTTALNEGDVPVYPISINVYGPVNNPIITNVDTGEFIQVNTNIPDGASLVISYDKDSLSAEMNGLPVLDLVSSGSTYFKIQPGGNSIQLTGSSVSDGSYVTTSYRDGFSLG